MSPTRDESQVLRSFCLGKMQSQLRPEMAVCLLQCTSVVHSFRVLGMVLKGNQLIGLPRTCFRQYELQPLVCQSSVNS